MKNPANINQPNLNSPIPIKYKQERKKGKKGNKPYLNFRRKLRRDMF